MIRSLVIAVTVLTFSGQAAGAIGGGSGSGGVDQGNVSAGVNTQTEGPTSDASKPPAPASAPMVSYVTYELTQDRPANTGDLQRVVLRRQRSDQARLSI